MREGKERIIYDNYDIEEQYRDEILEDLEEGESLTEQEIWGRMYFFSQFDWDVARLELKSFFSSGTWILTGTVGRWNGCHAAGTLFKDEDILNIIEKALTDCDYFKLYDVNGHLYLHGSHHDGDVDYEIKQLTEKGETYFSLWENGFDQRSEKYVHEQIEKYYSRLPHFAHKMYGVPKMEFLKKALHREEIKWNESQRE